MNPAPPAPLNYGTVTFGDREAWLLRENTDDHRLVKVARKVAETLAHWDIPHLIVGGVAVQEHGYPRFTVDVDGRGARRARGSTDRCPDHASWILQWFTKAGWR